MNKLALVGRGTWGKNYLPFVQPEYVKTRDYKDLFDKQGISAVIIATPTETHFTIAKEFIQHGFNLLIEKPITQNYKEAIMLKKLSEKFKTKVMAGHILLYDEAYQVFKKHLKNIGQIKKLEFIGLQSSIRKSSTLLMDWGPHPIYIFDDILKKTPFKIIAKYSNHILHLNFLFPGSIQGNARLAWKYSKKVRTININGKNGNITFDYGINPKKIILKQKGYASKTYNIIPKKTAIENQLMALNKFVTRGTKPLSHIDSAVKIMKTLNEFSEQLEK